MPECHVSRGQACPQRDSAREASTAFSVCDTDQVCLVNLNTKKRKNEEKKKKGKEKWAKPVPSWFQLGTLQGQEEKKKPRDL